MRTAIVIPARFASTRLPGKPLLRDTGKYLIQHVYEQAARSRRAAFVLVATDDERIRDAVEGFGGRAVMTRTDHPSGTDRIAEAAAGLDADIILNLQGDEPQFDPADLDRLADLLRSTDADVATLATPIRSAEAYRNPNVVKVVCDDAGRALYFSRSPVPYFRDAEPEFGSVVGTLRMPSPSRDEQPSPAAGPDGTRSVPTTLQHLGVYAYRRAALLRLAATPPHPLELAEKLEQLRVLGTGGSIRVAVTAHAARGVDTPDDYAAFVRSYRAAAAA